tara:strand:+ start:15056 stop:15904 length:849 start_codon:yes stop_codon:yes gene_type:complete
VITDRPKTSNRFYNEEKLPKLLTVEEEKDLAELIKNSNGSKKQEAKNLFIASNLRLVIKIARSYENLGLDLEDLISEGNIGLVSAVDRFDPEKGAKFSTYAGFWIRQRIMRALSNHSSIIRMPCYLKQLYLNYLKYLEAYQEKHDKKPSIKEISEFLNITERKVKEMLEAASAIISLDCKISEDNDGDTYAEVIKDERSDDPLKSLSTKNTTEVIDRALQELDPRERKIIRKRFGLDGDKPNTLEEIGAMFSVTRERIRQIERVALLKFKKEYSKTANFYLD